MAVGSASCSEDYRTCSGSCGGFCGFCGFGHAGWFHSVTLVVDDQVAFDAAFSDSGEVCGGKYDSPSKEASHAWIGDCIPRCVECVEVLLFILNSAHTAVHDHSSMAYS